MTTLKFANVLLESNPRALAYPSMYCVSDALFTPDNGAWLLQGAGVFDFTTYFNALSVRKLREFTTAREFSLHVELRGASCVVEQAMGDAFAAEPLVVEGVSASVPASDEWRSVDLPLRVTDDMVLVGFRIVSDGPVWLRDGYYALECDGELRDVELVLSTTTFKKESFIERNIALVKDQILGCDDDISRHFTMYVIDNGRTLDAVALSSDRVHVRPNENVGGAGGFTRGMIEAMEQSPKATHVLLMDDDVAVSPESIKRTYNLLRIVKDEYRERMISGAMLNYEVGEDQWEDLGHMTPVGTFAACKPPLRTTIFEDLIYNELYTPSKWQQDNMYAAWWYCCIPLSVIERNGLPLPVFVRCDDAEYGIRCKTGFITMNSLCIWHMSFHVRYNAAVERYQTTRNTMIAQATTGMAPKADFMYELHNNIRLELKKFGYENAELCLDAFEDFLKGPGFISAKGQAERSFMEANRRKEQLVGFEELQRIVREDPDLAGFDLASVDRQLIDGDKARTRVQRLHDLVTDNGQRYLKSEGEGYAVIPFQGWVYPAGVIRGKKKLIVLDWYNRRGTIRVKDSARYEAIKKRYSRDLRYYKANIDRLRKEYAAAREELTSVGFWKNYLDM